MGRQLFFAVLAVAVGGAQIAAAAQPDVRHDPSSANGPSPEVQAQQHGQSQLHALKREYFQSFAADMQACSDVECRKAVVQNKQYFQNQYHAAHKAYQGYLSANADTLGDKTPEEIFADWLDDYMSDHDWTPQEEQEEEDAGTLGDQPDSGDDGSLDGPGDAEDQILDDPGPLPPGDSPLDPMGNGSFIRFSTQN